MSIDVLQLFDMGAERRAVFVGSEFTLHDWADPAKPLEAAPKSVAAIVTNGARGLSAAEMDRFPQLRIVCATGAGYERVDIAAAASRGIVVTNGAGANATSVADHAMALLLAVARDIPQADAAVRRGEWSKSRALRPGVTGRRIGILGLGRIGLLIAQRAAGGFAMEVTYHNRRERTDVRYAFANSVTALAARSDFLVLATPGGEGTERLVDSTVLDALGPDGFLINIGRGSVVDTDALIAALEAKRIAGAGLDVIDGEPEVPPALVRLPNVILTPHIAARSEDAFRATAELLIANLRAHFAGEPVLTPVTA